MTAPIQARLRQRRAVEAVRFVKAQLSTGVATGAEWLCVWLFVSVHLYYVYAAMAGAIVGAVTDFAIKKLWVFGTARHLGHGEAMRYALVSATSALVFGGAVYALVDWARLSMPVAVVLGSMLVGVAWNYPMHRWFVFSSTATVTSAS